MIKSRLFEIGTDGLVLLNKEWIGTVPEFKRILERDRGSKGDADGRKKFRARKEFTYIYHMCDFRSPLENQQESIKKQEALRIIELTAKEVDNDIEIVLAMEWYVEYQEVQSLALSTFRAAKKGFFSLQRHMSSIDFEEKTESGGLVNNPKQFTAMMKELDMALENIEELERKAEASLREAGGMRGQARKGKREDPV